MKLNETQLQTYMHGQNQKHWQQQMPIRLWSNSESEVARSCPTLRDPMDGNLPGSAVHGIFQARILEWAAISFSRGSSQPRDQTQVSCIADRCFTVWAMRGFINRNSYSLLVGLQNVATVEDNLMVCYKTKHSYHTILQSYPLVSTQRSHSQRSWEPFTGWMDKSTVGTSRQWNIIQS